MEILHDSAVLFPDMYLGMKTLIQRDICTLEVPISRIHNYQTQTHLKFGATNEWIKKLTVDQSNVKATGSQLGEL